MNYKQFYLKTYDYLLEVALKHGVNESKLKKYFVPGSLKNRLPGEPKSNSLNRIFCRLCFHAQNGTMRSGVINYFLNYKTIRTITYNFNPNTMLEKYKDSDKVFKKLLAKMPHDKDHTEILELYSKTIYYGAKFIASFGTYQDFISKLVSYDEFAPEFVMYNVPGMKTLAYDFLKELDSSFDICKPDLHLIACMQNLFGVDKNSDKNALNYHVSKKCKEVANKISLELGKPITTYKLDKMLYLVCTETFYNDDNIKNKDDVKRNAYISFIKSDKTIDYKNNKKA